MRLRSTENGTKEVSSRADGAPLAILDSSERPLPLLPEQMVAVRAEQAASGRSFEEIAVELGFLPEAAVERLRREPAPVASLGANETADVDPLVVMVSNPDDTIVNTARELRGAIGSMETRDGSPVRRVALLALQARAENSVLAANLAAAFAVSGQRTLLVDANFAAPVHHALFRRSRDEGVAELLRLQIEPQGLIQTTGIPNLDLLACGAPDGVTAELTDRSALALATEHVAEKYSAFIVDAGEADQIGISCAQGFDATIIIVQRGLTPLREARKLVDRLRSAGDAPVGTVIID
jgi:protein-tyrosine kinase